MERLVVKIKRKRYLIVNIRLFNFWYYYTINEQNNIVVIETLIAHK